MILQENFYFRIVLNLDVKTGSGLILLLTMDPDVYREIVFSCKMQH